MLIINVDDTGGVEERETGLQGGVPSPTVRPENMQRGAVRTPLGEKRKAQALGIETPVASGGEHEENDFQTNLPFKKSKHAATQTGQEDIGTSIATFVGSRLSALVEEIKCLQQLVGRLSANDFEEVADKH